MFFLNNPLKILKKISKIFRNINNCCLFVTCRLSINVSKGRLNRYLIQILHYGQN